MGSDLNKINEMVDEAMDSIENFTFDPLKFLDKTAQTLREACGEDGIYNPVNLPSEKKYSEEGQGAYFLTVDFLTRYGYFWAAEQLLFDWWIDFGLLKRSHKRRIYQANTAYKLMILYSQRQDRGAALRWALLTQADDILNEHPEAGGAGKQLLRTVFGMSQLELEEFNRIANTNRTMVADDWSQPMGFAEDVLVQFALKYPQRTHLLDHSSTIQEFPISQGYIQALIDQVDNLDLSDQEKGAALENLASYLFLLVPGWVPRRNVYDEEGVSEHDIIVSNVSSSGSLSSELFGRHFLVECKNWDKSVGTPEVGYFLYRMHLAHAKCGIVVAREGISGENERYARALIRRAYHEDDMICIVLDRQDLDTLANHQSTVWALLIERMERFRFGSSRYTD